VKKGRWVFTGKPVIYLYKKCVPVVVIQHCEILKKKQSLHFEKRPSLQLFPKVLKCTGLSRSFYSQKLSEMSRCDQSNMAWYNNTMLPSAMRPTIYSRPTFRELTSAITGASPCGQFCWPLHRNKLTFVCRKCGVLCSRKTFEYFSETNCWKESAACNLFFVV